MLTQHQKEFLKLMGKLERVEGLRLFEAFSAFLELAFCALAGQTLIGEAKDRNEARYMEQIGRFRHPKESAEVCVKALHQLIEGLEAEPQDFLGVIFMECAANPHTGQFFTPWHLCMAMAEMTFGDDEAEKCKSYILNVQEPACGCGGMILAFAEVLKKRGINPATQVHCELIDVDPRCVKAAYIQTTLMGISATVIHGNTLSLETWGSWDTIMSVFYPKKFRIAAKRRAAAPASIPDLSKSDDDAAAPPPPSVEPQPTRPRQLVLEF